MFPCSFGLDFLHPNMVDLGTFLDHTGPFVHFTIATALTEIEKTTSDFVDIFIFNYI